MKMPDTDLGSRKSLVVVVVVVGCFAVLWPKVLQPMMVGPSNIHSRTKQNLDKGCCDVISDIDLNTIKIMNELCNSIVEQSGSKFSQAQDTVKYCRSEVLDKCGIDISAVLQEQTPLGFSFKQIVEKVRSFNGSLCLKYKFGISPWSLGVAHKVSINLAVTSIRQERSAHMRPEALHPALREKGSAISRSHPAGPNVKYVDGRPGPVPGMRPPMGGGHIAQNPKGSNSMGVIMPMYTIGIVIFFSYTLMKVIFRKKPDGPGSPLYPPVDPSPIFRKQVFESQKSRNAFNGLASSKLVVNAMTALLDEVDHELEAQRRITEKEQQNTLVNSGAKPSHDHPSVKILGMETTASCEGGQKWSRPESPVIPSSPVAPPEPVDPPQEIYLEGALPAQSRLLVADAITEPEATTHEDPAVVLASKMTLSLISLDATEANEKDVHHNEVVNCVENDDVPEESKYTTASCATAAESDVSEDNTDEEEIDNLPDCVVDNGIQELDIDTHTDEDEIELEEIEDEEIEEVDEEIEEEEEVEEDEEVADDVEDIQDALNYNNASIQNTVQLNFYDTEAKNGLESNDINENTQKFQDDTNESFENIQSLNGVHSGTHNTH